MCLPHLPSEIEDYKDHSPFVERLTVSNLSSYLGFIFILEAFVFHFFLSAEERFIHIYIEVCSNGDFPQIWRRHQSSQNPCQGEVPHRLKNPLAGTLQSILFFSCLVHLFYFVVHSIMVLSITVVDFYVPSPDFLGV